MLRPKVSQDVAGGLYHDIEYVEHVLGHNAWHVWRLVNTLRDANGLFALTDACIARGGPEQWFPAIDLAAVKEAMKRLAHFGLLQQCKGDAPRERRGAQVRKLFGDIEVNEDDEECFCCSEQTTTAFYDEPDRRPRRTRRGNVKESTLLLGGSLPLAPDSEYVARFPARRIRKDLGEDALRVWLYLVGEHYRSRRIIEVVESLTISRALAMTDYRVVVAIHRLEDEGLLDAAYYELEEPFKGVEGASC